jgi:hypothetical protein
MGICNLCECPALQVNLDKERNTLVEVEELGETTDLHLLHELFIFLVGDFAEFIEI